MRIGARVHRFDGFAAALDVPTHGVVDFLECCILTLDEIGRKRGAPLRAIPVYR